MKTKLTYLFIMLATLATIQEVAAQGTAFTYQGRLNNGSALANGNYDFEFTLFNTNITSTAIAGPVTNAAVMVTNGLFTTLVDFGPNAFTGTSNWLEIAVSTNGANSFTTLSPRQQFSPVPYAITAENLAGVVENNNIIQDGVSLATISGGSGNVIESGANDATIAGGADNSIGAGSFIAAIGGGANNSIGTNDDTSTIAGGNSNIIQDGAGVSTISGGVGNQIQTGSPRSTISGGSNNQILDNSQHSVIAGGGGNQIQNASSYSTISGGLDNMIETNAFYSTIGGGVQNTIQTNDEISTIAGGSVNTIANHAAFSTIGGGSQNTIQSNAAESTISGGYLNTIQTNAQYSSIGGGLQNTLSNQYATVSGGYHNTASGLSSFVGGGGYDGFDGGAFNVASGPASVIVGGVGNNSSGYDSFIGAGVFNNASGQDAVVAGGSGNSATNIYSTVGGGLANTNTGYSATVGGGLQNTASGSDATVPGGYGNVANGLTSFAAGNQANANNQGTFVWADSQNAVFSSTANDQFLVRAQGGMGINMNNPGGAALYVQGNRSGGTFNSAVGIFENTSTATGSTGSGPALRVICDGGSNPAGALSVSANGIGPIAEFGNGLQFVANIANDGTLTCKSLIQTSDWNAKQNFTALDGKSVLAKVISLPVTEWNYKDDAADKKHIGPMAQDFHAAFDLNGADDKHISVIDEGGVALAAIQGLNQKLEETRAENTVLKRQNDLLAGRLNELEATVKLLVERK
jgi:trimeric autotransporter adhesin